MAKKQKSPFCRCKGVGRNCRMKAGFRAPKGGGCPVPVEKQARPRRESRRDRVAREYKSGGSYAAGFEKWKREQEAMAAHPANNPGAVAEFYRDELMLNGLGRARARARMHARRRHLSGWRRF